MEYKIKYHKYKCKYMLAKGGAVRYNILNEPICLFTSTELKHIHNLVNANTGMNNQIIDPQEQGLNYITQEIKDIIPASITRYNSRAENERVLRDKLISDMNETYNKLGAMRHDQMLQSRMTVSDAIALMNQFITYPDMTNPNKREWNIAQPINMENAKANLNKIRNLLA